MSRTNRTQRDRDANRPATDRLTRAIERQLSAFSDEDVFALTFTANRHTRRVAERIAHERAERYALSH